MTCLLMKAVIKVDVDYKNSTNAVSHRTSKQGSVGVIERPTNEDFIIYFIIYIL